jgi:hypothetical protein
MTDTGGGETFGERGWGRGLMYQLLNVVFPS